MKKAIIGILCILAPFGIWKLYDLLTLWWFVRDMAGGL